jgi:UDP-2-acetamido-2,6-beta-L-arabino-hexul-4-ose reductase
MTRIGITGVEGLIGWHLRCFLKTQAGIQVLPANRETFSSPQKLAEFAAGSDAIVHLAGMNRGDDQAIATTNISLTEQLIAACEAGSHKPHVLFASSAHVVSATHANNDTAYSRSKRTCSRLFEEWAGRNAAAFTNLILPHVFGELGKPFYNSVVSTFCHQIAVGKTPEIIHDGELELVHALQLAQEVLSIISARRTGVVTISGIPMTVSVLLEKISAIAQQYRSQIVPDLRSAFDLDLFNTYRSYLYPAYYPVTVHLHSDNRGSLFEAIKSRNGGQSFISTSKPGITRGNHFHMRKVERFCVLGGEAVIRIRRLFSSQVLEFPVSGKTPQYIDIPTLHTHNITNTGPAELTTLFWAHEIFDPKFPDTLIEQV